MHNMHSTLERTGIASQKGILKLPSVSYPSIDYNVSYYFIPIIPI